ncbi:MAG: DEAD/DEAH box helicase [Christensenellales bacterium]
MTTNFKEMNLSPEILAALEKSGFETATTVQAETIPAMREWRDVIAKAPTGTGKTIAFAIPLLEHINFESQTVQSLILSPTRELAIQICDEIKKLAEFMKGVRIVSVYGGQSMDRQIKALKRRPQIVVATPGRLMDHIRRRNIDIRNVNAVVLDEADRMLDMGFVKDVTRILDLMPKKRHLALMSATISREVMDIAWMYQRDAVEITVQGVKEDKPQIVQYSIEDTRDKAGGMMSVMGEKGYSRVIVFCNTKHAVRRLTQNLASRGCAADCIHGDLRQSAREKVMDAFRKGKLNVLVATDVAARGIDVDGIEAVFNYDLPNESEYYIHRIGRTGRAQKRGASYTFVTAFEALKLKDIAKYTKSNIISMRLDNNGKLVPARKKKAI